MVMIKPIQSRLKTLRLKNCLSQREFQKRTGVHFSTVSKIEKHGSKISPGTAKKICDYFNVPFDELFEISEEGE